MTQPKKIVAAVASVLVVVGLALVVGGRLRGGGGHRRRALSLAQGRATLPASSTLSVARLVGSDGAPDNCADVTWQGPQDIDFDRLRTRGFVVLKSTCAESFADLVALASCVRSEVEDGSHPLARGTAYYYDLATLGSDDTYRGQCLGTGGDWKSTPELERSKSASPGTPAHHEIDSLMELLP